MTAPATRRRRAPRAAPARDGGEYTMLVVSGDGEALETLIGAARAYAAATGRARELCAARILRAADAFAG